MEGFRALLLEGVFYNKDSQLLCTSNKGVENLFDMLTSVEGQRIKFAAHHLPPTLQPDPSKWGGGCCLWQPAKCPAGHSEKPTWLFNLSVEGILVRSNAVWSIESFDGKTTALPLQTMLVGHYARVAAATMLDVEKMREAVASQDLPNVEGLASRAEDLRKLLSRLREGGP